MTFILGCPEQYMLLYANYVWSKYKVTWKDVELKLCNSTTSPEIVIHSLLSDAKVMICWKIFATADHVLTAAWAS